MIAGIGKQDGVELFLDVDGVIVNFITPAIDACGLSDLVSHSTWSTYDDFRRYGLSGAEFVSAVERCGQEFWERLKPYPWADKVVDYCRTVDPYFKFLTKPMPFEASRRGKLNWLTRYGTQRVLFADEEPKHVHVTGPHCVLIDDCEPNIDQWRQAGGTAILFPQPWNRGIGDWSTVLSRLEGIKRGVLTG